MKKIRTVGCNPFMQGLQRNFLVVLAIFSNIVGIIAIAVDKFYLPAAVGFLAFAQVLKILHDYRSINKG
ncbi:MAG: hypothetical protein WC120_02945 [Parcubacteria group bacterium]